MPASDARASNAADTALLVDSLREAGGIARKYFGGSYRKWDKGGGNPVTEADIAIDRRLHAILRGERPDYGWLSEETEDDFSRLAASRVFVVDPIDGTFAFVRGRPHFTIVAAVVTEGRPVSAAIYNPITDEMFEASLGAGARLSGEVVHASDRAAFENARILGGKNMFAAALWKEPWPASMTVENRSSLAYRLALVAEGQFDAMVSLSTKHDWDLAAGDLILHEAGGRLSSQTGETLLYNQAEPLQHGVIGAGPGLHGKLLARFRDFKTSGAD